jgi:hypothetical protein
MNKDIKNTAPEQEEWNKVIGFIQERFNKEADVKEVLFVIGLRESGKRKKKFTKEEKQDMMNLAACKVFSLNGYFEVSHLDGEGWPVWRQKKPMPQMQPKEQEEFIKKHIVQYFREEKLLD